MCYTVTGSDDNTVRVCNSATGVELARMHHDGFVRSVATLSDGRIVSGSGDKTVRVWQESKACVKNYLKKISLSYDAHYLVGLLLEYKDYLQKKYPERKAIRIQDVVLFANTRQPEKKTTVESLTQIRNTLPRDVQRALVKGLGIYSCPDDKLTKKIKRIRGLKTSCS